MLAEGAHSIADTVNELFLLTSHRRSARPADASHADGLDSTAVEDVRSRIEQEIGRRHPEVTQVFLDATRASARERLRAHRLTTPRPGKDAATTD